MPVSPALSSGKLAIAVTGGGASESVLNEVLAARGFAPALMVASLADLTVQLRARNPAVVLVPIPDGGASPELALLESELRRHPATAAIAIAAVKDADTVLAAMRSGITEFLLAPVNASDLDTALGRVSANAAITPSQGRVFTVYSGKGGLGTSTVSLSLAYALAHLSPAPSVALLDFGTTGAGARVMLNLAPLYDLGSVAARANQLDREFLRSVMCQTEDGVAVLAAGEELDAPDPLDASTSARLIELLRREYDYVVIDTDHHFADQTIAALDAADTIVLLSHLDVSALRSTQRTVGVFTRLGYPESKVRIVVNRQSDRDRISLGDAERVIGRRIATPLPNDYTACADAITFGRFVQAQSPSSPLVPAMRALAASLAGVPDDAEPVRNGRSNGSRLARLFGRH
jgi:pilus assembly protein CpaE